MVGTLPSCQQPSLTIRRLQNTVIDLEVANETPSPTVDPSVRVVLVGHSMGGLVAAETYLAIASETPVPRSESKPEHAEVDAHGFMFPYIQGILAFDTPYLGIAPSVLAHGAESHYQTASSAYSAISSAASALGFGGGGAAPSASSTSGAGLLTSGPQAAQEGLAASANASADAAAAPAWQRWGRYAMFAGAAGAVAAGGAAAYLKRDALSSGWSWATSHLEFVGCLMRGEELKARVGAIASSSTERGIGFLNLYTTLGPQASKPGSTVAGGFVEIGAKDGERRTFCNLPVREDWRPFFRPTANEKAHDEVAAHMGMFAPRENPGYYRLGEAARDAIVEWVDPHWYRASEAKDGGEDGANIEATAEHLDGEEPVLI